MGILLIVLFFAFVYPFLAVIWNYAGSVADRDSKK